MVSTNGITVPVVFHAVYRNYGGVLLEANEVTGRAKLHLWDDILSGGCWRDLWVDLNRVEVLSPIDRRANGVAV